MSKWTYEVHELSEGFSAIVYDEHGQYIADHLSEETARLIAAAPDLLEAGEDLIARLEEAECDLSDDDFGRQFCGHVVPFLERFKWVVARAKGGDA